jgi:MOSC domain-containing protein YiiM
VLDLVWRDREGTLHPGDTFVCDLDTGEANLPEGQLLAVGSAVLRVSEVWNDGCAKWKVRYGEAAYDWIRAPGHRHLRLRGVLCSIQRDGVIRLGDPVHVLR